MERRALLQWMVSTGGLAAFARLSPRDLLALGEETHARLRHGAIRGTILSPDERRTVTAAAECIIPRTTTPGATDARVSAFIEMMLADWYPTPEVERFRAGLGALGKTSTSRFSKVFADATPEQQASLVQSLDDEVAALRRTDSKTANTHWFAMLKYLTVWGFCTSEVAMREVLHTHPRAMRYDGSAAVET
jgi:hypothetical protein